MLRKLSCLFVFASMAAACGTEDPGSSGSSTTDPTVDDLEASGIATNSRFRNAIPAIRFSSDVNKGSSGPTHCTAFRFTKQADRSSAELAATVASGENLTAHMDFIHPNPIGDGTTTIFQQVDLSSVRTSMVEQATAPPDNLAPSVVLEEVTLVPAGTATYTLTSAVESGIGGGPPIIETFTCKP